MATEDSDTESGGQTDDTGDTSDEAEATSDDTGGESKAANDNGEKTVSRKERRANVMREAKEARAAAERERDEYRQRQSQTEAQLAELRGRIEERERSNQNTDKSAQTKTRIASLRSQARDQIVLAASFKGEAAQQAWDRHQELMDEADDLRDEMRDEARWDKRKGEMMGKIPDQGMMESKQYIQAKYPWVATNARARGLADATFADLVQSGRPASMATMEEAITFAAKTMRITNGNGAPNPASRRAYEGTGQRDGEGDDGGSGTGMSVEEVRNNLPLKRMAQLAYPQLEAEQAYVRFAKDIGTKAKRQDA